MPIEAIPAAPAIRQPRANSKTTKPTKPVKSEAEERTEGLIGLGQIAHAILLMTKQYADAGAVRHFFPSVAKEVANLADGNEKIAAGVDYVTAVGPYTALCAAVIPFGLQIAANHKRINPDMLAGSGVIHPDILVAEEKTELERMRTEAILRQREAERERKAAEDALERSMQADDD